MFQAARPAQNLRRIQNTPFSDQRLLFPNQRLYLHPNPRSHLLSQRLYLLLNLWLLLLLSRDRGFGDHRWRSRWFNDNLTITICTARLHRDPRHASKSPARVKANVPGLIQTPSGARIVP